MIMVKRLKKLLWTMVLVLAGAVVAEPISFGRLTFENFVTDASDGVAGIYFSTVCEPGTFQSKDAAYVVIGCVYPAHQAVDPTMSGDLVIPSTIMGLPVRRVNANAFTACTRLTSITFPPTLREVGPKAFSLCTSLTNVTFLGSSDSGVEVVCEQAFTNCVSLQSVKFPASFRRLGREVFVNCDALERIDFLGNAPELDAPLPLPANDYDARSYLGEKRYTGTATRPRAKIYARPDTYGWRGPYKGGLPEKWPIQYGWATAHDVYALPASAGTVIKLAEGRGPL